MNLKEAELRGFVKDSVFGSKDLTLLNKSEIEELNTIAKEFFDAVVEQAFKEWLGEVELPENPYMWYGEIMEVGKDKPKNKEALQIWNDKMLVNEANFVYTKSQQDTIKAIRGAIREMRK